MGKVYHEKLGKSFVEKKEGIALIEGIKTKPKEFITGAGAATAALYVFKSAADLMTQYSHEVQANLRPIDSGLELGLSCAMLAAFAAALGGVWYLNKHNL